MIKKANEIEAVVKAEMLGGKGEVMFHHLADKEQLLDHARLFSILTLEKGCGIGYHIHTNEREFFYVLQGTPTVNDNGTEYVLAPGDSAMTELGGGHSIENRADETAKVLALIMLQ